MDITLTGTRFPKERWWKAVLRYGTSGSALRRKRGEIDLERLAN